jgi:hypothetical protein
MNGGGKSDSPVVPAKPPNKPAQAGAEAVEEGGYRRGTRPAKRAPDTVLGKARQARWTVCAKQH